MIETLLLFRLFADFFWEHKILSATSVCLIMSASLLCVLALKKRFRFHLIDVLIVLLITTLLSAEALNPEQASPTDAYKLFSYLIVYFSGRVGSTRIHFPHLLLFSSIFALICFSISAAVGYGYQYWGAVHTFSGGYFFKTDMALSALILLTFIVSQANRMMVIIISSLLTTYLVFKTNTRIAIPLTIAIPLISYALRRGWLNRINIKTVAYSIFALLLGMSIFTLFDFSSLGLLSFDFKHPLSAANTQGRAAIWSALLEAYSNASTWQKMFGMGLGSDIYATSNFYENNQISGLRAHSSYLYILLSGGIVGTVLFIATFYKIANHTLWLTRIHDNHSFRTASLLLLLMLVFLWFSLTTEVFIRPQLMVIIFFLAGVTIQNLQRTRHSRPCSHY